MSTSPTLLRGARRRSNVTPVPGAVLLAVLLGSGSAFADDEGASGDAAGTASPGEGAGRAESGSAGPGGPQPNDAPEPSPAPAASPEASLPPPPPPTPDTPRRPLLPAPALLDAALPQYPEAALQVGAEGAAAVLFTIDDVGATTTVEVLADPGHGLGEAFAASVRDAIWESPAPEARGAAYVVTHRFVLPEEVRARFAPADPPPEPADELTEMPLLVEQRPARYPEEAKARSVPGTVTLQLDVSDGGTLDAVELLSASPAGFGFEEEAVRAVWGYRFKPAMAGPAPVPVRITYTYQFQVEERVVLEDATTPEAGAQIDPEGPVNLQGFVRERGTRRPLPGVEVLVEDLSHSVVADDRGYFEFRGLPAGLHRVLVAVPGYETFETEEEILPGQATDVVYFVRESPLGVPETIVRVKAEKKEVTQRQIRVETIERVPGTFGDPVKVVQNLPGVARAPFDFGLLLVRGSGPEDSGPHIDGIRVPALFHFGGLRSIVTPILLDGIEFLPGGYGPAYGRLTGGILDVQTRTRYEDQIHGMVQADLIDASVAITGPIRKKGDPKDIGGFVVAARRSYLDVLLPALAPATLDLSNIILPRWSDVQGKVTLRPNDVHNVSLVGYWSQDRAGTRVEDPGVPTAEASQGDIGLSTDFWRVTADWKARPSDRFENRLLVSIGDDIQSFDVGQFANVDIETFWWMVRDEARIKVDDHLRLRTGVDFIASAWDFEFDFGSFDVRTLGDDPNVEREALTLADSDVGLGPAVFAEAGLTFAEERVQLFPGVRLDVYTVPEAFGFATVDPRFSFRVLPDPKKRLNLKGSVGVYHQNPQGYEILDVTGNTDLQAEVSVQATGGVEIDFTDFLSLDVQGFYKRLDKLVVFSQGGVSEGGSDSAWVNTGDGHIWGAEVFLRFEEWKNFEGWVSFTYQRSQRRDAPDEDFYWYDFDQPIILDVVASYQLPYGFRIGGRFRYTSGNPETPITDSLYDSDSDSYIGIGGTYNSGRLPSFHALDIRIDKDINFRRWKLSFYLEIMNIYNHKNPESTVYNFDYTEKTYLYGLPILPNLGFKAQF